MSERCMESVWKVFVTCIEGVWNVPGKCMEGVCNVPEGVLRVAEGFPKMFFDQRSF